MFSVSKDIQYAEGKKKFHQINACYNFRTIHVCLASPVHVIWYGFHASFFVDFVLVNSVRKTEISSVLMQVMSFKEKHQKPATIHTSI